MVMQKNPSRDGKHPEEYPEQANIRPPERLFVFFFFFFHLIPLFICNCGPESRAAE